MSIGVLAGLSMFSIVAGSSWRSVGLPIEGENMAFSIDPLTGAIEWVLIIMMLSTIIGIKIWNSGLSESTIRYIQLAVFYYGLFGIMSALSLPLLIGIPIWGLTIYIVLTIMFTIGFFKRYVKSG